MCNSRHTVQVFIENGGPCAWPEDGLHNLNCWCCLGLGFGKCGYRDILVGLLAQQSIHCCLHMMCIIWLTVLILARMWSRGMFAPFFASLANTFLPLISLFQGIHNKVVLRSYEVSRFVVLSALVVIFLSVGIQFLQAWNADGCVVLLVYFLVIFVSIAYISHYNWSRTVCNEAEKENNTLVALWNYCLM